MRQDQFDANATVGVFVVGGTCMTVGAWLLWGGGGGLFTFGSLLLWLAIGPRGQR